MLWLTTSLFSTRAFLLGYYTFPHMYPVGFVQGPTPCPSNKSGRYQRTDYLFKPWWNKIFSGFGKIERMKEKEKFD